MNKPSLREYFLALRSGISPTEASQAAQALIPHALPYLQNARCVAAYLPMRGELNILPLMTTLAAQGITTALPVIHPNTKILSFHAWKPGDLLANGPFGVQQPPQTAPVVTPEVILVPMLAFDDAGHRLGYGGGYYDATLRGIRDQGLGVRETKYSLSLASEPWSLSPPLFIGVAYSLQHSPTPLPAESFDERLDGVVTERQIYYFHKQT